MDIHRMTITEKPVPAGSPAPAPPPDGRVYLAGYETMFGIPSSCPVCGDDTDIHDWWDVEGGVPVSCDRSQPRSQP